MLVSNTPACVFVLYVTSHNKTAVLSGLKYYLTCIRQLESFQVGKAGKYSDRTDSLTANQSQDQRLNRRTFLISHRNLKLNLQWDQCPHKFKVPQTLSLEKTKQKYAPAFFLFLDVDFGWFAKFLPPCKTFKCSFLTCLRLCASKVGRS